MKRYPLVFWFRTVSRELFGNIIGVLCLVLGIVPALFIFTWILHETSYDRFHAKSQDIYRITIEMTDEEAGTSVHFARSWFGWLHEMKNEIPGIKNIARLTHQHASILEINNEARETKLFYTGNNIFDVFDFEFIDGDPSQALLHPGSVVITESTAKKCFGKSEVLGESLQIYCRNCKERETHKITGVIKDLPLRSHFHFEMLVSYNEPEVYPGWAYYYLLLEPGTKPDEIASSFYDFAENCYPEDKLEFLTPHLQNIRDIHLHSSKSREIEKNGSIKHVIIIALFGVFVLVTSLFNFINLVYFSFTSKSRSLQLKKLHGAVKRDIFTEQVISVIVPGTIAVIFSFILFNELWTNFSNLMNNTDLSPGDFVKEIILLSFMILLIITILGIMPLFFNASLIIPANILNRSPLSIPAKVKTWFKRSYLLVIMQYAFGIFFLIVMLISQKQVSMLLTESISNSANRVISIQHLPSQVINKYPVFKKLLQESPGIIDITSSMETPGDESMDRMKFIISGIQANTDDLMLWVYPVDINYFNFHGHEIIEGHDFPELFPADSVPEKYILNESAVKTLGLKPPEALGRDFSLKLNLQGKDIFKGGKIIGVVEDFQMASSKQEIKPFVFFQKSFWLFDVQVKIQDGKEQEAIAHAKESWQKVYPGFPFQYKFVEDIYAGIYESEIELKNISLILGMISILLSALGLIGISSIHFQSKIKEAGIRKVLGASFPRIISMFLTRYILMVLFAAVLAIPIAYGILKNWLQNFALPAPLSFTSFFLPVFFILLMTLGIILLQVVKVLRTNPVHCLRE